MDISGITNLVEGINNRDDALQVTGEFGRIVGARLKTLPKVNPLAVTTKFQSAVRGAVGPSTWNKYGSKGAGAGTTRAAGGTKRPSGSTTARGAATGRSAKKAGRARRGSK